MEGLEGLDLAVVEVLLICCDASCWILLYRKRWGDITTVTRCSPWLLQKHGNIKHVRRSVLLDQSKKGNLQLLEEKHSIINSSHHFRRFGHQGIIS